MSKSNEFAATFLEDGWIMSTDLRDQEIYDDAVRYSKMVIYNAVATACPILPTVLVRMVAEHLDWCETLQPGDMFDYRRWLRFYKTRWMPAKLICYEADRLGRITFTDEDGITSWEVTTTMTPAIILPCRAAVVALLYPKNP